MDTPPEKSTGRELLEKTVEGTAGMVPFAGGPLGVALALAMGWSYNKRMQQWLDDVAVAITELQEATEDWPSFEELAQDDVFVDAVLRASQAAQATHQAEKLDALRNGVLNSPGRDAPDVEEQARFFRLVDQFTASHLRLLVFLHDPKAAFTRAGLEMPNVGPFYSRARFIARHPDFAEKPIAWVQLLAGDLAAASLTAHGELHTNVTGDSLWLSATSPLGDRFLNFISAPLELSDRRPPTVDES
ncbi:hypothetical protein [uncultured Modestobacter sp.]|uniref:hypothetical protein n=1 Tax=uncultured Modestobacter sp. TaxID=380048 RepID=UPI002625B00A|nr:hypothetical protein [uncultured Modestobacter sp.]